jgi:pimeloyl-ACP methyl ester carboxylesterase
MENLRMYGNAPYSVAVVHGGPGAAGEMVPVAQELASQGGVLEPLQTAASLEGQIDELKTVLEEHGDLPVTLIGFSWGAWLCFLVAAHHPALVKKLILVSSGGFQDADGARTQQTRLQRLNPQERAELQSISQILEDPASPDKDEAFARFGALYARVDAYDLIAYDPDPVDYRLDIYQSVWADAADMRRSGRLLEAGKHIQCPVVAIHGDYDPHPAEGVQKPLSSILQNFRFILLEKCGHMPWLERHAKDTFYRILKDELRRAT